MTSVADLPSQTKTSPRLRRARIEDYAQIEQLESAHGLLTMAADDWRGLWLDNPLFKRLGDNWPIGWALEDGAGRLVGSLLNIPTQYTYRGRDLVAATGRAWVVAPQYRGIALWLMDEYFNQHNADLFLNTTVNSLAVDPFTAFGSTPTPVGDWETAAFWITNYRGFAKAALRIKHAPGPALLAPAAAAALWIKDTLTAEPLARNGPAADIDQTSGFDPRFDAFWQELVRQNPSKLLGVRNSQSLTWHFAGPLRAGQLWVLTASRNGLMRAYCIVKRQDHPPSGLIRMRVVDYQTLEARDNLLAPLLRAAIKRCVTENIHVLEHVGCDLPKMRTFDLHAPYRRKLPAWSFYFSAADAKLQADLQNAQAWDPSAYDGDASL